jgi:hypothetical protein
MGVHYKISDRNCVHFNCSPVDLNFKPEESMKLKTLISDYENRKSVHEAKLFDILQKETYTQKECDAIFAHKVAISMTNEFLKSLKNVK